MKLQLRRLLLRCLVLLAFAATGCSKPAQPGPKAEAPPAAASTLRVSVVKPERKTLRLTTTQPGRIEAFEQTPLVPKVAGYVDEVLVDIGDNVKKDQTLLKISVPELNDDLEQKEALVAQAEAELKQVELAVEGTKAAVKTAEAGVALAEAGIVRAQGEHDRWTAEHARIKQLASRGAVTETLVDERLSQVKAAEGAKQESRANIQASQATLAESRVSVQKSEADLTTAIARVRVAKANLARTQTLLGYTEIKAPFAGVITRRSVDTGRYVAPATNDSEPLLEVCRTDIVRVFVDVPELEAEWVTSGEAGDAAVVRVQALEGKSFDARVTRTSWSLNPTNRSLRAEIDVPNADGVLRPGMFATAEILLETRPDVVVVPVSTLVRNGPDQFCWLVRDGKANRVKVDVGLRSGSEVEIRSGVALEDAVVATPPAALQPEQAVEVNVPEKK